jgi:hypothetical protein
VLNANPDVLAWLECDSLSLTLPLHKGEQLSLGRDTRCSLVLPDMKVSRYQANLRVIGANRIMLHDEGSSHGTFVNGKRRHRHMVSVGDLIQSGPYEIGIRATPKGTWARFDPRRRVDTTLLMALGSSTSLAGKIPDVRLAEVLQWIEFTSRSCQLIVSDGMQSGRIVFKNGRLMSASFSTDRDRAALTAMLMLPEGSFAVLRDAALVRATLDSTVTSVLLDTSRECDERSRDGEHSGALIDSLWQSTDGG